MNKKFAVYVNGQYVGDKSMIKNQGEDLLWIDEFLREKEMCGYTMTNQGDTIQIQVKDAQKAGSIKNCLDKYLNSN